MSNRVRVNVRSLANTNAVRSEKRNGRDVLIVPSATLPDNVVMNDVMYPADEIEKSYMTLNRSPAPAGHPLINNEFVSARDPEGINIGWVGAWNENVRRENGRVFLDKVIDVERANQSAAGKAIIAAIEAGGPVHTSTGLYCNLEAANGDVGYSNIARAIEFDHDAILVGEDGAATPAQGVGMMVNSKGEHQKITVINSSLDDQLDQEIEWAVDSIARAIERKEEREENRPLLTRIKSAILEALGSEGREPAINRKDADMTDKTQFDDLSKRVNALTESAVTKEDMTNALTEAMKPLLDAQAEIRANQVAKDKADHDALVNKVVDAKIEGLGKDVAEKMDATALNAVLTMHTAQNSKKAAPLASGFMLNTESDDDMSPLGWGAKQ